MFYQNRVLVGISFGILLWGFFFFGLGLTRSALNAKRTPSDHSHAHQIEVVARGVRGKRGAWCMLHVASSGYQRRSMHFPWAFPPPFFTGIPIRLIIFGNRTQTATPKSTLIWGTVLGSIHYKYNNMPGHRKQCSTKAVYHPSDSDSDSDYRSFRTSDRARDSSPLGHPAPCAL